MLKARNVGSSAIVYFGGNHIATVIAELGYAAFSYATMFVRFCSVGMTFHAICYRASAKPNFARSIFYAISLLD